MHKTGYTLIEIMASVMIMTVMMGIAIISFRGVTNTDRLKTDLVRVAGIVREARSMAFNGVIPKGSNTYPTGGYGIYLNKLTNQIILFADVNDNNYYDGGGEKISESSLNARLHFTLLKEALIQNNVINEQIIIFDGDDYPMAYNQSEGCYDVIVNGNPCSNIPLSINSHILFQISSEDIGVTVGPHANCNGQIKISPKNTSGTIEPLLIDTFLEHC